MFATGSGHVKLRAMNVFSSEEVDVDMFASCGKSSAVRAVKSFNLSLNSSAIVPPHLDFPSPHHGISGKVKEHYFYLIDINN